MLIHFGPDGDDDLTRSAKLKALADHFETATATLLNLLDVKALSTSNRRRSKKLVVSATARKGRFAGFSPAAFFDLLASKGFEDGSFDELYFVAYTSDLDDRDCCCASEFASDFHCLCSQLGILIDVYAPRGLLSYAGRQIEDNGQCYWRVETIYVQADDRKYSLDDGLVLAQSVYYRVGGVSAAFVRSRVQGSA